MGIRVSSLFWVTQDLYHPPFSQDLGFRVVPITYNLLPLKNLGAIFGRRVTLLFVVCCFGACLACVTFRRGLNPNLFGFGAKAQGTLQGRGFWIFLGDSVAVVFTGVFA